MLFCLFTVLSIASWYKFVSLSRLLLYVFIVLHHLMRLLYEAIYQQKN